MTKAILTKFPGVQRRADSGLYQFGLRVPVDLAEHFPGKWAVRCSLKTADLREANTKAKALQAEWAGRFDALRSGKPQPIDLQALRRKLYASWQRFVSKVDTAYAGLSKSERDERIERLEWQMGYLRQCLDEGFLPEWEEDNARRYGDPSSPIIINEFGAHLLMLYEVMHEAVADERKTFALRVSYTRARRDLVEAQPQHVLSTTGAGVELLDKNTPSNGKKIADAVDAWTSAKPRSEKTRLVIERHASQFSQMMDDPWLSHVDRTMAIAFRDKLQAWAVAGEKTARTADNVLVSIRALFNVARDKGWLIGNAMERLAVDVGGKESEGREPWTHEELQLLFDDPIWNSHLLPTDIKAGGEAAFWVPLIACYTGARLSEICQLWVDDISTTKGKEVIEFRPNKERGQKLKNKGSRRAVPMHSELVRLGLCEYVQSLPRGSLFPNLPKDGKNGAGSQFGQWFGTFKQAKGFSSPSKSFHSFRHLVATELRLAGATDALADTITGHAGTGVGRNIYAATMGRRAESVRATIELLRFTICGSVG